MVAFSPNKRTRYDAGLRQLLPPGVARYHFGILYALVLVAQRYDYLTDLGIHFHVTMGSNIFVQSEKDSIDHWRKKS